MSRAGAIPIIDVFAGPGGLGEGFSALMDGNGNRVFKIAMSVEKDEIACRTLRLRSVRRRLGDAGLMDPYFALLRGEIDLDTFNQLPVVQAYAAEADAEVMQAELGKVGSADLDKKIRHAVKNASDWLLIGGPPCQAYSLAGRSRRTNDVDFESDEKHFLYREYLRILKVHAPPIFIMENVKGILSSSHGGSPIFSRIRRDLANPTKGLTYEIRSLVKSNDTFELKPEDYVIESEKYGIPQCRHRVILMGVRSDLANRQSDLLLAYRRQITVQQMLGGMPPIRSRLSRGADSISNWHETLKTAASMVRGSGIDGERRVITAMNAAAKSAKNLDLSGAPYIAAKSTLVGMPKDIADWLSAPGLGGVIQHESRGHMASDLARYLFSASFVQVFGYSPDLSHFPELLLPKHKNVLDLVEDLTPFMDRFRVQRADRPSSTVVSHIAKDGHYFIHYDPGQCRSLTVREAARLQTFPEDYFFAGNRTQQYAQVGNAVPPLLAYQIARVVQGFLKNSHGMANQQQDTRKGMAIA